MKTLSIFKYALCAATVFGSLHASAEAAPKRDYRAFLNQVGYMMNNVNSLPGAITDIEMTTGASYILRVKYAIDGKICSVGTNDIHGSQDEVLSNSRCEDNAHAIAVKAPDMQRRALYNLGMLVANSDGSTGVDTLLRNGSTVTDIRLLTANSKTGDSSILFTANSAERGQSRMIGLVKIAYNQDASGKMIPSFDWTQDKKLADGTTKKVGISNATTEYVAAGKLQDVRLPASPLRRASLLEMLGITSSSSSSSTATKGAN